MINRIGMREAVYRAIDSERAYQDALAERLDRPDMHQLSMGEGLACLEHLRLDALAQWYSDAEPYPETLEHIRKIAGICVVLMERYGAPHREAQS